MTARIPLRAGRLIYKQALQAIAADAPGAGVQVTFENEIKTLLDAQVTVVITGPEKNVRAYADAIMDWIEAS